MAAKKKWYENKAKWERFRRSQAKRFGMEYELFKRFFKSYPERRNRDLYLTLGVLLKGRPEIAAFMGITVDTLDLWRVKFPDLPIHWGKPCCTALADCLFCWQVKRKNQMPEKKFKMYERMVLALAARGTSSSCIDCERYCQTTS